MSDWNVLTCPGCNMAFFVETLMTDEDGNLPIPVFCPFCGHSELEKGVHDFTEEKWQTPGGKPKLTLIKGDG